MRYKIIFDCKDGECTIEVTDHESDMDLWSMIEEQHPDLYDEINENTILGIMKISDTIRWYVEASADTGYLSWRIEAPDDIDFYGLLVFGIDDPVNSDCRNWLKTHAPDLYRYAESGKIHDVSVIE